VIEMDVIDAVIFNMFYERAKKEHEAFEHMLDGPFAEIKNIRYYMNNNIKDDWNV
jgi:hypothetical protein